MRRKANERKIRKDEDLEMASYGDDVGAFEWPHFNVLPMKRLNRVRAEPEKDFGFIIAHERTTIYFGNVFEVAEKKMTLADIKELPSKKFSSLSDMLDEYVVD